MLKTGFIQSSKRIRTTDLTRNTKTAIGSTACTPPVRLASTSTSTSATRKPFVPPETPRGQKGSSSFSPRVGTVFITLTSMAIALTATGLYQFYQSFSTWPKELRDHLRSALKAKQRGDIRRADKEFRLALTKARELPPDVLGKDPILKTTGIAIALASMLEEEKQFTSAYQVYSEALDEVLQEGIFDPNNSTSTPLTSKKERSPEERMRAVSIAQRLGDLVRIPGVEDSVKQSQSTSSKKSDSKDLAEKHLSWSVEELLKLSIPEETRNQILESNLGKEDPDGILLSDLELPPWVTHSELGASLESLGSLYAERGQVDFAVPLYLQALAILMPDSVAPSSVNSSTSTISKPSQSKRKPTAADRCRAAVLMNNLGQLFINGASSATSGYGPKLSKGSLDQGIAWTEKGLDIVLATQRMAGWDNRGKGEKKIVEESQDRTQVVRSECVRAEVTLLFNLGVMAEMSEDQCQARKYFQRAYQKAEETGMRDAKSRAANALSRLQRLNK